MQTTKKMAISRLFSALCVIASTLSIPVGAAKCFPAQSMINILAGVILVPAYAVGIFVRNSLVRPARTFYFDQ